jgi:hypothetical protein
MYKREYLTTLCFAALLGLVGLMYFGEIASSQPDGGEPGVRRLAAAPDSEREAVLGLNAHILTDVPIRQIQALGITHVRTTILWPRWVKNDLAYRAAVSEMIARTDAAGIKLTVVLHNYPGNAPVFKSGVNRRMMLDFAAWAAEMAGTFPSVEAWQLWNEQDVWWQAPFGASDGAPYRERGRLYADQLVLAYPLIKRANPRALVVSGGTADYHERGHLEFLRGMLEKAPPVDAIAIHTYGPWQVAAPKIREVRRVVGDHAPLWVTESGVDFADDRQHEAGIRSIVEGNEAERLAERIYLYALDAGEGAGLGLVRAGRPRRSYEWLRNARAGAATQPSRPE